MRAATLEELALEPSIRQMAADFAESTGVHVQLEVTLDGSVPLAPELAQAAYRAVQEGLTNVQRHARATQVRVALHAFPECLVLDVQDDGVGSPLTRNGHAPRSNGYGLLGLRERVALLDGELTFGSAPGDRGSHLRIALPLKGAHEHVDG
jgi:signal transduction histidine kinase